MSDIGHLPEPADVCTCPSRPLQAGRSCQPGWIPGHEGVTIPMLSKGVGAQKIALGRLITHRYKFDKVLDAYETFGSAAKNRSLKVIIEV